MWLLNVRTRELEYFANECETPYAILSHTWEEEEVTFQDMKFDFEKAQLKKGYVKIDNTCRQAIEDGFEHVWIDTCCINKESSAELSEAINAMFWYYKIAVVCYVFLSDLGRQSDALEDCRWFTRGWTLQELLAPLDVRFFKPSLITGGEVGWILTGTKLDLSEEIASITRIDQSVLLGSRPINSYSVATRMSWAADRQTIRVEDRAYSLLGIFDVNMPLIYGEEENAFRRLQREIVNVSHDHSIFVWDAWPPGLSANEFSSIPSEIRRYQLLAHSPDDFRGSANVEQWLHGGEKYSYQFTNIGLETHLRVVYIDGRYCWILPCRLEGAVTGPLAINLLLHKLTPPQKDTPPGTRWHFSVDRVNDDPKRSKQLSRGRPLPQGVTQIPVELAKEANLVPARIEHDESRERERDPSWLTYQPSTTGLSKAFVSLAGETEVKTRSSEWRGRVYPLESWADLNTFDAIGVTRTGVKTWSYGNPPSRCFALAFRLPPGFGGHGKFLGLEMALAHPNKFLTNDEAMSKAVDDILEQRAFELSISKNFEWGSVEASVELCERMGEKICKITLSTYLLSLERLTFED